MSADSYADLLEELFAEFENRHSLIVIEQVVQSSRDELTGQVSSAAHLQMIDQLARQRLHSLPPSTRYDKATTARRPTFHDIHGQHHAGQA